MLSAGFYNMDCMDAMREFPDKFFELAIVDPPRPSDWKKKRQCRRYSNRRKSTNRRA